MNRQNNKWSTEEDQRLLRQVRAFPQNLHKCFIIVSEEINRTPTAVASHWYTKVSKNPEVLCFFTASPKHFSKNRKNGMGIATGENIWKKFMRIITNFIRE